MVKLVLIFFLSTSLFAQVSLDSLARKIVNLSEKEKVETLSNLCWKYRSSHPELAIDYANEAIKIANKIDHHQALPKLNNYLGVVYRNIGHYNSALDYYHLAAQYAESEKDSIQIAYALNNIGGIYRLQGFYPLALESMIKAIKFFEAKSDKSGIGFCAINIGIIYRYQQNYSQALEYLNYSLKVRKELDYQQGIALTLNQIAVVYVEQKKYGAALNEYEKAFKIYTTIEDLKGIAAVNAGKGNVSYLNGKISSALKYAQKALALDKKIKNIDGQIYDLLLLGKIYSETGEYKWADEYISHALSLSKETKTRSSEMNALLAKSDLKEKSGDIKSAYKYFKEYTTLKDSLFSDLNAQRIAEKQSSYDFEKRVKENEHLKEDIETQNVQKKYLIVIFFLVLLMAIVLYLRFKHVSDIRKKLEDVNSTKDKFFNILAHDLRNPFNATLGYTNLLINEFNQFSDEEKLEMIERIDESAHKNLDLLENLLSWALLQRENVEFCPSKINLNELAITSISHLQHMADEKNISLEINISEAFNCYADHYMITTVFRNLVTNSIKFTRSGGKVILSAYNNDKTIVTSIEDTGVGIAANDIENLFKIESKFTSKGTDGENGTGLGLLLCKEFVEKNSGTLSISSEVNEGTTIKFSLPIFLHDKN